MKPARDPGADDGYAKPLSLSDAGPCANNPCDPTCQVFEEDPPDAGFVTPKSDGGAFTGGNISSLPGGFENKLLKDKNHPPGFIPCLGNGDCQADHHCVAGACEPWAPGAFGNCGQPDFTVGVPCNGYLPICNRGSVASQPGVEVVVMSGNSAQLQSNLGLCLGFAGQVQGSCTINVSIPPGQCVNATGCLPFLSGTRGIVVNSVDFPPPLPQSECTCANNWSAYSNQSGNVACQSVSSFVPLVHKESYTATCPVGTKVQWGLLTYEALTPSNASGSAKVTIQAHTAQPPAAVAPTCADCVTIANVPAVDPQSCKLLGPAPCPKDLYALLKLPSARQDVLELVFTLDPTPDKQLGATLSSWQVTYSCPDAE